MLNKADDAISEFALLINNGQGIGSGKTFKNRKVAIYKNGIYSGVWQSDITIVTNYQAGCFMLSFENETLAASLRKTTFSPECCDFCFDGKHLTFQYQDRCLKIE